MWICRRRGDTPKNAYGLPDRRLVQHGGPAIDRLRFRNASSQRYLHSPALFTEHFHEAEVAGGTDDQRSTGGRTWDGRVNTGHDQALIPLLDGKETANATKQELFERLRKSSYADAFRQAVSAPGEHVLDDPEWTETWITVARDLRTVRAGLSPLHEQIRRLLA